MNFNFFGFGKKETKIEEKPILPQLQRELDTIIGEKNKNMKLQPEELFAHDRVFVTVFDENEKNLEVLRYSSGADSTLGLLFINDVYGREFLAYTLEDEFREEKVSAETRIPEGTYDVKLRTVGGFHNRYLVKFGAYFHKGMLHVQDVPGFEYILIHTGNTDGDTMGCLLVADTSQQNITQDGFIGASVAAYKRVYPSLAQWLVDGNKLSITYIDYDNPRN